MPTWNSWYNPFDNIAKIKGLTGTSPEARKKVEAIRNQPTDWAWVTAAANPFDGPQKSPSPYAGAIGGSIDTSSATPSATPRQRDDPYTSTSSGGGGSTGGSGGSGAPAYNPDDLAYLDSQSNRLKAMLGSAQNTLNSGLTNLSDSFNREQSGANQRRSRALEDFSIQREDSTRDKQDAIGRVDTNARTLNDSLRRILGLASGSGSSAYKLAAPTAVARQASQQRSGVLGDYAENDRNLSLAETRATNDFNDLLADLERQKRDRESELRSGVLTQEQQINERLANVAAERAKLLGGGYSQVRLAQAPFESAINSRQSELDSLFERFRSPMLTPKAVNVQKPELRDYLVDRASINANAQGGPEVYSPYAQFLRPRDDDEENLI